MRIFVDYKVRNHLVTPLKATWKGATQPHFLDNANILSINATLHGHQIIGGSGTGGFLGGGISGGSHVQAAAPGLNKAIFHAVYQPANHFWPLQLTETALFAGIAVLLVGFAAWWVRERVA